MALRPAKLSDFKVAGALGSGATSRVYGAVHRASGRSVAIKVLEHPQPTRELRERFAREALLLAGVDSRHVGRILGFGFDKGQPFLVLERLEGETLDAKLRRDGPVPLPLAVRWIEQLIVGVRDCHDANIIHRDIKPSNIFLHRTGYGGAGSASASDATVKLIDFGVARLRDASGDGGGLTAANHVIGSMGYMAPEQFESAKAVSFSADVYAVGVVIFRTLTGRLPFISRSYEAVIRMKSELEAPQISAVAPVHNPLLDWFVRKAMTRAPEARFQSAREMLERWWAVMSSLDDNGATDVEIARPDRAEALGEPPVAPPAEARTPAAPMAVARSAEARTPAASSVVVPPGVSPPAAPLPLTAHGATERPADAGMVPSEAGAADDTLERGPTGAQPPWEHDLFDSPTRSDPSLRALVERELELQKKRERGG